jgi:hypothetical protein
VATASAEQHRRDFCDEMSILTISFFLIPFASYILSGKTLVCFCSKRTQTTLLAGFLFEARAMICK